MADLILVRPLTRHEHELDKFSHSARKDARRMELRRIVFVLTFRQGDADSPANGQKAILLERRL